MFKDFKLQVVTQYDTNTNTTLSSQLEHALTTSTTRNRDGHISTGGQVAVNDDRCSRYTRDPG